MQYVCGHSENLGNECADHAAAHSTFGLTSSYNVATRWIHHNFESVACFLVAVTTSMKFFWNDYNESEWRLCQFPKLEASIVFIIGSSVSVMHFTCI